MVRGALSSMPGQDVATGGISASGTKGLAKDSSSTEKSPLALPWGGASSRCSSSVVFQCCLHALPVLVQLLLLGELVENVRLAGGGEARHAQHASYKDWLLASTVRRVSLPTAEEERPNTQASQRSNAIGVMLSPMTACGEGHAYAAYHACHEKY